MEDKIDLGDGDGGVGSGESSRGAGFGVVHEILLVVDDGDVKGAAWASGDLLPELEVVLGNLEEVAAGAGVGEGLQLLVPLHVLNLHVVVRHLPRPPSKNRVVVSVSGGGEKEGKRLEED